MALPKLFSQNFGILPSRLDTEGFLDPFVDLDLPLFIDPLLIAKSSNAVISTDGLDAFRLHFEQLVRLLIMSEKVGDPAWLAAERHLSLREPPENGLGYGRRGRSGSSRPARIRRQVLKTTKQIIRLGSKDPEMISLMGFLEDDVGSDTISDLTTRALSDQLSQITNSFCIKYGVPVGKNDVSSFDLPIYVSADGVEKPMILVPRDLVRHLPMTYSWSDVWAATEHNRALRDRVNKLLGGIVAPTVKEQKEAVRKAVLQSSAVFDQFLDALKQSATNYDPNEDVFGYYAVRDILISNPIASTGMHYDIKKGPDEIYRVVLDSLESFKHHVENGNLWEALWAGDTPKRERASQLIYHAIADSYAKAHQIDITAEPNMGGGPVDFKFSNSYSARVLIEMKRSGGQVEHGYDKQLEFYKKAAKSEYAVFVVMDYGDGGNKIKNILKMRDQKLATGKRASDIVVIDARKKASPSKRN